MKSAELTSDAQKCLKISGFFLFLGVEGGMNEMSDEGLWMMLLAEFALLASEVRLLQRRFPVASPDSHVSVYRT